MEAQAEGASVALVDGEEKQVLTLREAVALQASLGSAIQAVMEEKVRVASGLLVTPEDTAWEATLAEIEFDAP
jgi:hypothetical protein